STPVDEQTRARTPEKRMRRQIIAMGGGGFSMEPENPLLDDYVLGLTGKATPRVCFLPTASGDAEGYVERFHVAFAGRAETSVLHLFRRTVKDLEAFVLAQDVIYVGGGNTANMLAVWRVHGLDRILGKAWNAGVILCGLSAGALCWFEGGVTDSFGAGLAPLHDGLGLLPGTFCPHYDGEALRRPTFEGLVRDGGLAGGWAADDGVGLHFEGAELVGVVSSRAEAAAFRLERGKDGALGVRILKPTPLAG
ncbi:MAG TPA: peptidase E, partial [Vulgatibacter sp.]